MIWPSCPDLDPRHWLHSPSPASSFGQLSEDISQTFTWVFIHCFACVTSTLARESVEELSRRSGGDDPIALRTHLGVGD